MLVWEASNGGVLPAMQQPGFPVDLKLRSGLQVPSPAGGWERIAQPRFSRLIAQGADLDIIFDDGSLGPVVSNAHDKPKGICDPQLCQRAPAYTLDLVSAEGSGRWLRGTASGPNGRSGHPSVWSDVVTRPVFKLFYRASNVTKRSCI